MQTFEFLDEAPVDFLAAGGVENEDGAALLLGPCEGLLRHFHHVGFTGGGGVARDIDLFRQGGELVDGGGAVEVAGDEQWPAALAFQAAGELGAGGRLAGAVEPADEDAGGRVEIKRHLVATEQRGEFVVEDLDDLFAGFDRLHHVFAHRLVLHPGDEVLGDAELDIGLEQGDADLAQRVGDVFL